MIDFIGIGAGKSGSTWLYENIRAHPEVFKGNPKEIQYFNKHYKKGISWYENHFLNSQESICGEFSVQYLLCENCAERIKKDYPNVKLIAILRNPVSRMYSDYQHSIRKAEIKRTTKYSEFIRDENRLKKGVYYNMLKRYYDLFDKKNIKVLILEDVVGDESRYIKEVYEYIGVKNCNYMPDNLSMKINASVKYRLMIIENIMTNTSRLLNDAGFSNYVEKIKKIGIPDKIRRLNKLRELKYSIDKSDEKFLKEYYSGYNERLFDLISYTAKKWE